MIYSLLFIEECRHLSNECPDEIKKLGISIEINDIPRPSKRNHNWERNKSIPLKERTVIKALPPDIKRITGILNKISEDNYDKMVSEALTFNYADPEVVGVIFKKIINEPFYSNIYAKFCKSLVELHSIINERCIIEFNKTKHKNLGKFIGELYLLKLINNLDIYIDELMNNIDEQKLETLCKIISTVGINHFKELSIKLDSIKTNFSNRYRFMIMDTLEDRGR